MLMGLITKAAQLLKNTYNLFSWRSNVVVLANKFERIEKLLSRLRRVEESESVSVHEPQVLLGWFNFASGFYAGKPFKLMMPHLNPCHCP